VRRRKVRLSTIERTQNGPSYNSSAAMYPEKSSSAAARYAPRMCCSAFFPPRLHPVLNRRKRHKDAVVPPEMPTGRTVRQAVLHHQPHGHRPDTVRVVALGRSQVRHVHVEVPLALTAIMLRVPKLKITRSLQNQITEIVEGPLHGPMKIAASTALGARAASIDAAAAYDPGFRQGFNTRDSFGTIRSIFSRSRHGHPPWLDWERKNTAKQSPHQE